ncbi:MAG: CDP-alcohol phosphatidyltransferase family protein [Nitrospina sp.]|jgi:1L-myo-inositol 1-phosphate cytidylyltransferase / CDP-L-myo-inositol myo-inositolphosphotransferase|nr:CDP-alcohol phosphatidyltransferase family protein [Nitrospina sp.]MBT5631717.1 CDP-alcohol phosphatidyltransferase family protein [Nitrospina sp.]
MNENSLLPPSKSKAITAILLLPAEPDLYWQDLAGVPFLLRNILTLQQAGIKKLAIWPQESTASMDIIRANLDRDPRIDLDLEWITDLSVGLQNLESIILDGSTLLEVSQIREAMAPSNIDLSDSSTFRFFPDMLGHNRESQEKNIMKVIPPCESLRLNNKEDFLAVEERLLKSVGLSNDSLMDRLVTRFISRQLTRLFLKTSLTPNQITFLSLLLGLGSAWCFFQGTYFSGLSGSLLLLVSAWVDCTDGEIARLKFMETPWGARFDIFCDNIVHFFVFFSIGMGVFFATGDPIFKLYGGLAVYGSLVAFMILSGIIVKNKQAAGQGEPSESNLIDQVANRDFIYFLLVMAWLDRLDIFILLTAIGANVFALYLMYQRSRWGNNSI